MIRVKATLFVLINKNVYGDGEGKIRGIGVE